MSGREVRIGEQAFWSFLRHSGNRIRGLYFGTMGVWSVIYGLPLVIGALISDLLAQAASPPVDGAAWWLLWTAVGLMVLRAIALWGGLQLTFVLIFKTSAWIKVHVLARFLRRPVEAAVPLGNGEVLNRLRDDSDEIGGLLEWTTDLVYRSILLVVAVLVLAISDLAMTIPLVLLAAGVLVSVFLKNRVAALQAETRARQGRIGAEIGDALTGIRDLRLGDRVEGRIAAFQDSFEQRRRVQLRHQVYLDLLSDLFRNLVFIGTAVVLLTVSVRISHGGFSLGKLVLFLTYASWLGQQMYFFGKILARWQSGSVSFGRLTELADGDESAPASADALPPLRELVVSGLTCAVSGDVAGSDPVSFTVRPGQLVVITGEIGSGKSSVVRSLLGLQPGVGGSVRWNGLDVAGRADLLGSPLVGFAGQQSKFLQGTLRENLVLGSETVTEQRIDRAMAAVALRPGTAELPGGLDTQLDSGAASQLSGGQRQRLALARMLCREAQLNVVDDCDSSLDGPTARAIWQALLDGWPAAWVVVSRNEDLLARADVVVAVTQSSARLERAAKGG
jgi:ATP-binding cassette subfamily B protein